MPKLPKEVSAFIEKYGVDSDELWCVHNTTWVVKHRALERVAMEHGIIFDRPELKICDLEKGIVVVLASAKLGDRAIHSFGEATTKNCKNAYMVAMAEKRAADRVILKLLAAHGTLYSEAEAEEFAQPRQNPYVNRAADFHEDFATDADIPTVAAPKMKVKDARPMYGVMVKEMRRITDPEELQEWGKAKALEINAMPGDWLQHFRAAFADHKKSLNGAAA